MQHLLFPFEESWNQTAAAPDSQVCEVQLVPVEICWVKHVCFMALILVRVLQRIDLLSLFVCLGLKWTPKNQQEQDIKQNQGDLKL